MSTNTKTFTLYTDDGDEEEVSFPVKLEVCSRCEGHGTHLTPSIGEHAYTMDEFFDEFDDEGREEYFKRGGIYDVICERCKGRNVEAVIDQEAVKRDPVLAAQYVRLEKQWEEEADHRAEQESERRYGA